MKSNLPRMSNYHAALARTRTLKEIMYAIFYPIYGFLLLLLLKPLSNQLFRLQ